MKEHISHLKRSKWSIPVIATLIVLSSGLLILYFLFLRIQFSFVVVTSTVVGTLTAVKYVTNIYDLRIAIRDKQVNAIIKACVSTATNGFALIAVVSIHWVHLLKNHKFYEHTNIIDSLFHKSLQFQNLLLDYQVSKIIEQFLAIIVLIFSVLTLISVAMYYSFEEE